MGIPEWPARGCGRRELLLTGLSRGFFFAVVPVGFGQFTEFLQPGDDGAFGALVGLGQVLDEHAAVEGGGEIVFFLASPGASMSFPEGVGCGFGFGSGLVSCRVGVKGQQ